MPYSFWNNIFDYIYEVYNWIIIFILKNQMGIRLAFWSPTLMNDILDLFWYFGLVTISYDAVGNKNTWVLLILPSGGGLKYVYIDMVQRFSEMLQTHHRKTNETSFQPLEIF